MTRALPHLLHELGLVLGLLLIEPGVLEEDDIAVSGAIGHGGDGIANTVRGKLHLLAEELGHAAGAGGERELVLGAILGPSEAM